MKKKRKMKYSDVVALRISSELHMMLDAIAEDKNIRVTVLLRNVLEDFVKRELNI